jgi:undecaprenyl-diphosphatase
MSQPLSEVVLLGLIQGATEFLPVSSDGHLALANILFGTANAESLTLTVMLHAGTLLATLLLLWHRVVPTVREGLLALLRPARFTETPGGKDALMVILTTLPTAIAGLALRDTVADWTQSPTAVGLGFLVTAGYLVSTAWTKEGSKAHPTPWECLLLGMIQAVAIAPGISRSGGTIALALWFGVRRDRAFEISMLMSLPAVLGAIVLEFPHLLEQGASNIGASLVGSFIAFGAGCLALVILKRIILRGRFAWFALWVFPLGLATLALAKAWPSAG